jgi:competence protein ComEC
VGHVYNGDLRKGDLIKMGDVSVHVLWPPEGRSVKDVNDTSTVLLLDYGEFELLLTGDISSSVLASLDRSVISELTERPFDVFKVPHHGSKGSLNVNFLDFLSPARSVIQVGAGNNFGHPDAGYISELVRVGSEVSRTDLNGTVVIKVN